MGYLKVNFLKIAGLALGLCLFGTSVQAQTYGALYTTSQKAEKVRISEGMALEQALDRLEQEFGVVFLYRTDAVHNKKVANTYVAPNNVEKALAILLEGQELSFKYLNPKTYGIYSAKEKLVKSRAAIFQQVRGIVTDAETGETLPGVNVLIKGTSSGTATDADGAYELTVESLQDTLVFSFIGYLSQEVPIDGRTQIDVAMRMQAITGEELVVVGYGTQQRQDVTGSIGTVDGEDITDRQQMQVSQALQGAMAGVMVTRGNNAPGATADIRIRGITTIGNNDPLIIMDGIPVDNINDINPDDIEDITVLKDASAASIYGARAAAGVILVNTKRVKDGEFNLNYNFSYGFEQPTALPDYVNPVRYMEMVNELRWNDNENNSTEYPVYSQGVVNNYMDLNKESPDEYPITDWVELIMNERAPSQKHFLRISGGTSKLSSVASIGFDKINALYDGRTYDRITTRVNNDLEINNYLSAEVDFNFKLTNSDQPSVDPMYYMLISAPVYPAIWSNGQIAPGKSGNNIYASLKHGGFNNTDYNALGGRLSLKLQPLDDLVVTGVFAPSLRYDKRKNFTKQIAYYSFNDPSVIEGYIQGANTTDLLESRNDAQRYTTQFLANYKKDFGKHSVEALGGYENYYSKNESLNASRDQYRLTTFPFLDIGPLEYRNNGGSAYENAYRSYFGRISYNFDDKYLLEATIRRDGSSRFHEDYRWGNFPSLSAGWILSNESFLQDNSVISFLKLRASWGSLGNERIGNYPYQATISFDDVLFYQGANVVSVQEAAQYAYNVEDVTWEKTSTFSLGIDTHFFDERFQLTADYFNKKTKDMLLAVEIPSFLGFENPQQNAGKMETLGWEFEASWRDYIGDFYYSISFNLSDFTSTMGDLGGTEFLGDQIITKGSEFNEWYGYRTDGLFQTQQEVENSPTINANVNPGDIKYIDISGPDGEPDGEITPEYDRTLLGGSLPQMIYGGNINVGYKGLSLRVVFQGVGKQNSRINSMMVQPLWENWGNIPALIDGKYWSHYNTPEQNAEAEYPRLTRVNQSSNYTMSDYWLFDGSYFRVKNIALGYDLPTSLVQNIRLKGVKLTASVSDLFTISNYPKGWDPEVSSTGYPITTQMLLGLSIKL